MTSLIPLLLVVSQAPRALAPRMHIDTTLAQGATHRYEVRLNRGESIDLVVNQQGVDVVVLVLDSRDSILQLFDSPNGRQGPEPVELIAARAGRYGITVRPYDAREPTGRYILDVTAWRDQQATRRLLAARRLARDSAAAWLRQRSAPLDTAFPLLQQLAGRARVIGLGEATHGSREFGDLRLRFTRDLVERLGFRIVAIEASTSRLAELNRYVRGETGDRASIVPVLERGWIGRRALRELVAWLRQWNDGHRAEQVTLVGLDPQDNALARQALRRFLERAYPEVLDRYAPVERELAAADSQTWVFGNSSVDSSARHFLEELNARLVADAPLLVYTIDSVVVRKGQDAARQLYQFADFNGDGSDPWARSRDWHMAANLLAALAEAPGAKAVYWAHNAHVEARAGGSVAGKPAGAWLRDALGCGYAPLAVTFDSGAFVAQLPNDLEDRLMTSTLPRAPDETVEGVLRNLRRGASVAVWGCGSQATAPDWLQQPQRMHWVGGLYTPGTDPSESFRPFRLLEDFDGVVFFPVVSADESPRDRPLIPGRRVPGSP